MEAHDTERGISMSTPIETCLQRKHPPLPWVYEYAGVLEGVDPEAMWRDPGALAHALDASADLFGLPAVPTHFETGLEVENVGQIDSLDEALEIDPENVLEHDQAGCILDATKRLVGTITGTSVLGALTGPARLVESLLADDVNDETREEVWFIASDIQMAMANAYLDRGVDGLVVLEPDGVRDTLEYEDAIVPLDNLADHFGVPTVVVQAHLAGDDIPIAEEYGFDAVFGSVSEGVTAAIGEGDRDITLGAAIPDKAFRDDTVEKAIAQLPGGVLATSEWGVPRDASVDALHTLMHAESGRGSP